MGGDTVLSYPASSEGETFLGQFGHEPVNSSVSSGDEEGLSWNGSVINRAEVLNSGKKPDDHLSTIHGAAERQRLKVYSEVLRSYEDLDSRIDGLEEAKIKILSYTPGSWVDNAGGTDLIDYDVPIATSLLIIGPDGSGKSSLVNKISLALEHDVPQSGRAQVSYNCSTGDGTFFVHEYTIPKGCGSFCLYDTRGLSVDLSENQKMLYHWMKKGVRHGELIRRESDSKCLKTQLKCKARRSFSSNQFRAVDFVIFVVNGVSVLESMDSGDEEKKQYSQMIASNFNNPLLSFKDDKPVVVITHGDLLPLSDRVRVRIYLGELLGVPPTSQIFDIPDNNDKTTTLAIYDLLTHCLDRADRNFPAKDWATDKVYTVLCWLFLIVMVVVAVFGFRGFHTRVRRASAIPSPADVEWPEIRHIWSA